MRSETHWNHNTTLNKATERKRRSCHKIPFQTWTEAWPFFLCVKSRPVLPEKLTTLWFRIHTGQRTVLFLFLFSSFFLPLCQWAVFFHFLSENFHFLYSRAMPVFTRGYPRRWTSRLAMGSRVRKGQTKIWVVQDEAVESPWAPASGESCRGVPLWHMVECCWIKCNGA